MLQVFKKISQQITGKAPKTILYFILLSGWAVILVGTFLLLN